MSGLLACGCGRQTGLLLGKRSQKLLVTRCPRWHAMVVGQTRTVSSRRNRKVTHKPTSYTKGKPASADQFTTRAEEKDLFQQIVVVPKKLDDVDIGAELTEEIDKNKLLKLLSDFYSQPKTQLLAAEHGLDMTIYKKSFTSFRLYCVEAEQLPVEFHIVLSDIIAGAGHLDDIFPYFLQHARQVFPHLECIEELRNISDLTEPSNWYPEARKLERKIIYHVGPTNSGKTYHALQRFYTGKSGVYCGPLRMLAVEVFNKCNRDAETPCDLVTGEDRRQASPDRPADHVACTVEMASLTDHYEVAIIDEIQMVRDSTRGWAWTKALLGLCADEIHLCGEGSAVDLVRELVEKCGDEMEVRKYERLTKLTILDKPIGTLKNIRAGDCIVCFSKNDIYSVTTKLESLGFETAVIYGGLPPGTKYAQAEKFNDPDNSCNILVATDAIGMGLNLSIKRVIFFSLTKITTDKDGTKQMEKITTSQALQIAGRAGRYGTQYEDGEVTTFRSEDLPMLKVILGGAVEPIEQVGLHPTAEQIELFAYHLPKATLSNLIDIFIHLSRLDHDKYFMCNMEDFKYLANIIEHIPLALRVRYTLCSAPISSQDTFTCNMFIKFARQYSTGLPITYDWLMEKMKAPFQPPRTLQDLVHLEQAFDVFDLYLWLGYRFTAMFPDMELVKESQIELDYVIQESVAAITALLNAHKTARVKVPITISTEKTYGKKMKKTNSPVAGTVDSPVADISDLLSDSNVYSDDLEAVDIEGVETVPHNKTNLNNKAVDIGDILKGYSAIENDNREEREIGLSDTGVTEGKYNENRASSRVNRANQDKIHPGDMLGDMGKDGSNNAFSRKNNIDTKDMSLKQELKDLSGRDSKQSITQAFDKVYAKNRSEVEVKTNINPTRKTIKQEGKTSILSKTVDIDTNYAKAVKEIPVETKKHQKNGKTLKTLFQSTQPVTEKRVETNQSLTDATHAVPPKKQSLMRALIKKGLITDEMMAQLHREWKEAQQQNQTMTELITPNAEQRTSTNSTLPSNDLDRKHKKPKKKQLDLKNLKSHRSVTEKPLETNKNLTNDSYTETDNNNDDTETDSNNDTEARQKTSSDSFSDSVSVSVGGNGDSDGNNSTKSEERTSSHSDSLNNSVNVSNSTFITRLAQFFKDGKHKGNV